MEAQDIRAIFSFLDNSSLFSTANEMYNNNGTHINHSGQTVASVDILSYLNKFEINGEDNRKFIIAKLKEYKIYIYPNASLQTPSPNFKREMKPLKHAIIFTVIVQIYG